MKVIFLEIVFASIQSSHEVCTSEAHHVDDDIFNLVVSFEKDLLHPDTAPMKELLSTLQSIINDCLTIDIDLTHY